MCLWCFSFSEKILNTGLSRLGKIYSCFFSSSRAEKIKFLSKSFKKEERQQTENIHTWSFQQVFLVLAYSRDILPIRLLRPTKLKVDRQHTCMQSSACYYFTVSDWLHYAICCLFPVAKSSTDVSLLCDIYLWGHA